MEGTYPLPEAQLDRFMFKVLVPFPRADELQSILLRTMRPLPEDALPQPVASADDVERMLRVAREVAVAPHLASYAVRLVLATHPRDQLAPPSVRQYVRHGASPRGLQSLVAGAQVRALLEDRFNVARDDLRAIAAAALRHRLILGFEAQADGRDVRAPGGRRPGTRLTAAAMTHAEEPLFEPGFVRVLESLMLAGKRVPAGHSWASGGSPPPVSCEFADTRTYTPGDDYRRID